MHENGSRISEVFSPSQWSESLIMMCGLPFAGKTTLARQIAALCQWAYISLDAINGEYGVGLHGQAITTAQWERTYAEAYRRVSATLPRQSVVYDETNFLRQQRDLLRRIAAQVGVPASVLYVATSEAEARSRWQRNRITHERGDVRGGDFWNVVRRFERPAADENMVPFDPTIPLAAWLARTFPGAAPV